MMNGTSSTNRPLSRRFSPIIATLFSGIKGAWSVLSANSPNEIDEASATMRRQGERAGEPFIDIIVRPAAAHRRLEGTIASDR